MRGCHYESVPQGVEPAGQKVCRAPGRAQLYVARFQSKARSAMREHGNGDDNRQDLYGLYSIRWSPFLGDFAYTAV